VIEDDPVALLILGLLNRQPERVWQGTTLKLWDELRAAAMDAARAPNFPQSHVALGKVLSRIAPALRVRGVTMDRDRVAAGTQITLRATE
jgi:hypothetical protein